MINFAYITCRTDVLLARIKKTVPRYQ